MKVHSITRHSFEICDEDSSYFVNLPIKPSETMAYLDALVEIVGDKAVLGFLADDENRDNPCDDDDSFGTFVSLNRRAGSEEHRAMQDALALNSDWAPDMNMVSDQEAFACWANENPGDFVILARNTLGIGGSDTSPESIKEVFERYDPSDEDAPDLSEYEEKVWHQKRGAGLIGEPLAVPLDIYEHGLVKWSLSGHGMQDPFDTARSAGLWIPSDAAKEEIERRAKPLRKGDILETHFKTKVQYHIRTLTSGVVRYDDQLHPSFETYGDALEYLREFNHPLVRSELDAKQVAARDYCGELLDTWNAYLNGDTYCYEIVVYDDFRVNAEPGDHQSCCGYYGTDDAYSVLKTEFDAVVKNVKEGD